MQQCQIRSDWFDRIKSERKYDVRATSMGQPEKQSEWKKIIVVGGFKNWTDKEILKCNLVNAHILKQNKNDESR